jgi:hypothetical protein
MTNKHTMHSSIQLVLKDFPPSSTNNAREIVKRLLLKFKKSPSAYWAKQLEEVGVDVDFNSNDNGN